jgi:putative endonuclease
MTKARLTTGRRAEELVAAGLAAAGWELLERNARTRYGELDVVALDGTSLVFVEVKAGVAGAAFGPLRPIESIGPRKQLQVRRLATAWIAERRGTGCLPRVESIRFDAIGVTFGPHRPQVEHIRSAF